MAKVLSLILLLFALVVCSAREACAQTTEFTFQGSLRDGINTANGNYDFEFLLFDSLADGAQIGLTLSRNAVAVSNGAFDVKLDFGNQFPGANRFLEIRVRQTGGGAFIVLSPRQSVTSVPYSVKSLSADSATSAATATNSTQLNGQPATFYQNAANLSSGTLNAARLPNPFTLSGTSVSHIIKGENASTGVFARGVHGAATGASGATIGVLGESASTAGTGVAGLADANTGATSGVSGQSNSTSGRGVFGQATAASGTNYGGRFESASTSGRGVFGSATAASGFTFGVYGQSDSTSGRAVFGLATAASGDTYGLYGDSESMSGRGVFGDAHAGAGTTYGVYGQASSTSGTGVYGQATAASGATYGGRFHSSSPSGIGVYGLADAANPFTNYGGIFVSNGLTGIGVVGWATAASAGPADGVYGQSDNRNGRGVYGFATATSGATYGVYGKVSTTASGYAVYANGDMGASGAKPFRIDHPDDPANMYLLHYATESPEVINFYSGKATLDAAGEVVVELPRYFAKINKDPRYTLTAIGAPMPLLHVAEEIDEAALRAGAKMEPGQAAPACSFRIAGGAPGARVSWRVEAVRNDRWVQKRGAPVEVEKQGVEKGKYQHPELYGQPTEKGMNYYPATERPEPARP